MFFFGSGLTTTRGKHANVAALLLLTAELNTFTKFAAMPMRDYGNEAGADNVMSWLAGYPFGVDFTRGYPRSNPGEFTAVDLLARRDVDAALIVAADPWSTMPHAALEHLERIPHVVIDRAAPAEPHPCTSRRPRPASLDRDGLSHGQGADRLRAALPRRMAPTRMCSAGSVKGSDLDSCLVLVTITSLTFNRDWI